MSGSIENLKSFGKNLFSAPHSHVCIVKLWRRRNCHIEQSQIYSKITLSFGIKELNTINFPRTLQVNSRENHPRHHLISDPFADAAKGDEDGVQDGLVHIRIQQRNGRKTLTTIQGLSAEYDLKKIVRACKKVRSSWPLLSLALTDERYRASLINFQEFACNGTVVEHPEYGEVLQLQGDQRHKICDWLTKTSLVKSDQLKVHGF